MKGLQTALSLAFGAIALALTAVPAHAGLDFTDTAQVGGFTTVAAVDAVDVNGVAASTFSPTGGASTIAMTNGFYSGGADLVTFSGNATGSAALNRLIQLDFLYTGGFGGVIGTNYDFAVGENGYGMVVEFGAISIDPGASVTLLQIGFSEIGSPGFSTFVISQAITAADAGNRIFIPIPSTGVNSVALLNRDLVDAVRLEFLFQGNTTSVGINAVVNPEPGSFALFGLGALGLIGLVRRRRKARAVETVA